MSIKKIFCYFLIFSCTTARELFFQPPSLIGYYADIRRYYAPQKMCEPLCETCYPFYCSLDISYYQSSATKAFSSTDSSQTTSLSSLFHGASTFPFPALFEDDHINDTFPLKGLLGNLSLTPEYSYSEQGCFLGGIGEKNFENSRLRIEVRIPIKKITVDNEVGSDAFSPRALFIPNTQEDIGISIKEEEGNQVFAARVDLLKRIGFITTEPRKNIAYFALANNMIASPTIANSDNTQMSLAQIESGQMLAATTSDNKKFLITPTSAAQGGFVANSTTYAVKGNINNDTSSARCLPPLLLYGQNVGLAIKAGGIDCSVYPIIYENLPAKHTIFYVDTKLSTQDSGGKNYPPIKANDRFDLVALPLFNNDIGKTEHLYPSFYLPPVVVQQTKESYPSTYGQYLPLPPDVPLSDGTYQDYIATNKKKINFVTSTGTFSNTAQDAPSSGVFWFGTGYGALDTLQEENWQNLYITTSLDSTGTPTPESAILLQKLKSVITSRVEQEFVSDTPLAEQVIEGWFANKFSSGTVIEAPRHPWQWGPYSTIGFGDCTCRGIFGSHWYNKRLFADIVVEMILPTGSSISEDNNYLAVSRGNNGHYECTLGAQGLYIINYFTKVIAAAQYGIALPATEYLIAPLKNASAYGLQPAYIAATTWWQSFAASADVLWYASEEASVALQYQYHKKWRDHMTCCPLSVIDGTGNPALASLCLPQALSNRTAHTLGGEIAVVVQPECTLTAGVRGVIAGQNCGQTVTFFASVIMEY